MKKKKFKNCIDNYLVEVYLNYKDEFYVKWYINKTKMYLFDVGICINRDNIDR